MSSTGKSIETESKWVIAEGWGGMGNREMIAKGQGISFQGDENVLKFVTVVCVCECTKTIKFHIWMGDP
jgi:hypothetical protein